MANTLKDLSGLRFGRLTVIERASLVGQGRPRYLCKCDCGNTKVILGDALRQKGYSVVSCGCFIKSVLLAHAASCKGKPGYHRIHGASGDANKKNIWPEYHTWLGMRARCQNPKHHAFKYYGGRGITICDQWADNFLKFLEDVGRRPKGLTLDRINNDGNYEPGNCKWSTWKEQANNKRKRQPAAKV